MKIVKKLYSQYLQDSLYRNSFWLVAGQFGMSGVGFFYWMLASRFFSPQEVGLGTTFISAASLLNSFAILGFSMTLIRYLPTAKNREKLINSAFTIVFLTAGVVGIIYLLGLQIWTPKLLFIRQSLGISIILVLFISINTLNGITDSVFIAFKKAHYVFISNMTQSLAKIITLLFLTGAGAWGVISSNIFSVVVTTLICVGIIIYYFKITLRPEVDFEVIKTVRRFAFGIYISSFIGGLPNLILPIFITNRISPEQTAYFYIPNMITTLITVIPSMISRSYFTESSQDNKAISMRKPILVSYAILIPVFIMIVLFGKLFLSLFGASYAAEGHMYLIISTIGILVSVVNYFLNYRLLILHRLKESVALNVINTVSFILLAWLLVGYGIEGISVAGILMQVICFICSILFLKIPTHQFSKKS